MSGHDVCDTLRTWWKKSMDMLHVTCYVPGGEHEEFDFEVGGIVELVDELLPVLTGSAAI